MDPEINDRVHRLHRLLEASAPPGFLEAVPTYAALLVRYSPLATDYGEMAAVCSAAAGVVLSGGAGAIETSSDRHPPVTIPIVYGGEHGPDLETVARLKGLCPEEVRNLHAAAGYIVAMIGFAPGFPYLAGMDARLAVPRLDHPRSLVPAGSVGIAGHQTGIYPQNLPGGWRIIGRTPVTLWNPGYGRAPCLLRPGRRVRFMDMGQGATAWSAAEELAVRLPDLSRGDTLRSGGSSIPDSRPVARVLRAGPLDTVQDAGRWGHAALGVPESGPLDWPALAGANQTVGNPPGSAGLEVTYTGLALEFTAPAVFAVSHAAAAVLGGGTVPALTATSVEAGAVLEFRGRGPARCYLALRGGIACPPVLGSRATYVPAGLGGVAGRPLQIGDTLSAGDAPLERGSVSGYPIEDSRLGAVVTVRAVPGPQTESFSPAARVAFWRSEWLVEPTSDRRACMLCGQPIDAPQAGGLTDGTPAGSVQVPPSGQPVVLLADHQTTGGYPKVAVVIAPDLPLLARATPGTRVRFRAVNWEEAVGVWRSMGRQRAYDWPGNAAVGSRVRSVYRVTLTGRSHLVTVEPSTPSAKES